MSKAGQNGYIGLGAEADIALLYLLWSFKKEGFQEININGDKWEDFALVFNTYKENFEVKWHTKLLTFGDIRQIIKKEIEKDAREYSFKIVVRKINENFKKEYKYIKDHRIFLDEKLEISDIKNHLDLFKEKGWTYSEIKMLSATEIIEFYNYSTINNFFNDYLASDLPVYLDSEEQMNTLARSFREIMNIGKIGGSITRKDFNAFLKRLFDSLSAYSESFSPEKMLGEKIRNLSGFLESEEKFKKLNHKKYLTPISNDNRTIYYLAKSLEQNQFHVDSFSFFLDKVLLKKNYIHLTIKILNEKRKVKRANDRFITEILNRIYKNLEYSYNFHDTLDLLCIICEDDLDMILEKDILVFLEEQILNHAFTESTRESDDIKSWNEKEQVAKILQTYYKRTNYKKSYIDFIFNHFEFTGDVFDNLTVTHEIIYSLVKGYILDNFSDNINYVINKISSQFNILYNGKYRGYEWSGSSISQAGRDYSITDLGIVRYLLKPLFDEVYKVNQSVYWKYFKKEILFKKAFSFENPIYLQRALVQILIERLKDDSLTDIQKQETFKYLSKILLIKKGIPNTSEVIFAELRNHDLGKIGYSSVIKLIKSDSVKYKRRGNEAGYPTNLFVMQTLIRLIENGFEPAKQLYLDLIRKPEFIDRDKWYDSFELLTDYKISESDPNFIVSIFNNIDLEGYLKKTSYIDDAWDKGKLLVGLINRDWQDNSSRGKVIINRLLRNQSPGKEILQFMTGFLSDLIKIDPIKTYNLFKNYFIKEIFINTFRNNDYIRQTFVWLADELINKNYIEEAKAIIELCIDDPDPKTTNDEEDFNYHLKVKYGKDRIHTISTVRGTVAWVLIKLAASKDCGMMEYAFNMIRILIDLDGKLASKLGYVEPDLYVRAQALVPLADLANPVRRKTLNEFKSGLGDSIKDLALSVIRKTKDDIYKERMNPVEIVERLIRVFSHIRDLNTNEAKEILLFFEQQKAKDSQFLFIYYAIYREHQYDSIPFDASFFKEKLKELCKDNEIFRPKLSWQFWVTVDNDEKKNEHEFDKMECYWELLFSKYDERVFDYIYNTLEITLKWPDKYESHKELLKKAFDMQIDYYKSFEQEVRLWGPKKKILQIVKEHSTLDFINIFNYFIEKLNENIIFFSMTDWILLFKSVKSELSNDIELYKKIELRLRDLYPLDFE